MTSSGSDNQPILKSSLLEDSTEIEEQAELNESASSEKNALEQTIKKVIESGSLNYFYQPILCIGGVTSDNYSIIVKLKDENQTIGWYEILKCLDDGELINKMDHLIAKKAVDALVKLKSEDKSGYVFFPQSIHAIQNSQSADWLRDRLKAKHILGSGLVIEFRFSSLVSKVKEAQIFIKKAKALGCKVCISEFPAKKAAFKILQFLKADFIKVSSRLLETDSSVINTFVNQAHRLNCHVIVPNISDPRKINLDWTTIADYLQGEFISPEGEKMNFNFSQAKL